MIESLLRKVRIWWSKTYFDETCADCNKNFNAIEQSIVCPHITIKEFFSSKDKQFAYRDESNRLVFLDKNKIKEK